MALFTRRTMEQITQDMIDWTRATTSALTDFRVGSKIRSIYEALALVVEGLYDKAFKSTKDAIQQNVYTAFGFQPLLAVNATGTVRFYARNAPGSDQPFYIPSGTEVQAYPTTSGSLVSFRTTRDAYLYYNSPTETGSVTVKGSSMSGWVYVDVPVVCTQGGTVGNVGSGQIQTLVGSVPGIGAVNNGAGIVTGADAETLSQQKKRFKDFFSSRTRGTVDSIEYGATTAVVLDDTNTYVQERVVYAKATEGSGTFTVYVWNGVGTASSALLQNVQTIIEGYKDASGKRVYGYKPAGSTFDVQSVAVVPVPLAMTITPATGYGLTDGSVASGAIDLRPLVNNAVTSYFGLLEPGQTAVKSALEAAVKGITGVYDVQITSPAGNTTSSGTDILVPQFPITFAVGTTQ